MDDYPQILPVNDYEVPGGRIVEVRRSPGSVTYLLDMIVAHAREGGKPYRIKSVSQSGNDSIVRLGLVPHKEPKPAETLQQGLPVHGYQAQEPWKTALVNENKILEERVLRQIEKILIMTGELGTNDSNVNVIPYKGQVNVEMVKESRVSIISAFMWLNRAVFQPGRVTLPEDK